jgi:hypothetical protein
MLNIPYVQSSENACALACYAMIAKFYFPETTFEEIAKISDWQEGHIVWAFKFWQWITEKGIRVKDYDLIDYSMWANEGVEGMRRSVSEKSFDYYQENTKDLSQLADDVKALMNNQNFLYIRQKPGFEILKEEISKGNPCEVVLNSRVLNKRDGFALHRVVVLDVDDEFVTFHDPGKDPRPARKEAVGDFTHAWLEAVDEPELCVYSKVE